MVDFRMPSLGADMEAGTLVEWLVKPGDRVKRGDVVAVVETQKGAIEIEIFEAGKIEQILVDLNSQGAGRDPAGADSNRARRSRWRCRRRAAAGSAGRPARGRRLWRGRRPPVAPPRPPSPPPVAPAAAARARVSPAARRLAEAHGIDLSTVTGSGPAGEITYADVERRLGEAVAPPERKRALVARSRRHANGHRRRHGAIEAGNSALLSRAPGRRHCRASNG